MEGAGCRVQGAGCRVQGSGFGVRGAGCRVAERGSKRVFCRIPNTQRVSRFNLTESVYSVVFQKAFPAQFVNLSFTIVIVKDNLSYLCKQLYKHFL